MGNNTCIYNYNINSCIFWLYATGTNISLGEKMRKGSLIIWGIIIAFIIIVILIAIFIGWEGTPLRVYP